MSRPLKLIVSVDQVGLLRASRSSEEPDPVHFALQAELSGASGIRAHLRMDRKNIGEEDISLLNRQVKTQFYLQTSPHQDVLHLVNGLRPHNLILAAERRDERATDTGLDAVLLANELKGIIPNVDDRQTKVFLFIEPELDQIKMAVKLGAHGLLLNVRELMVDPRSAINAKKLARLKDSVRLSTKFGLETHLAGGIIAERFAELVEVPGIAALHVGHQLVARALQMGVEHAVRFYLDRLGRF